MPQAVHSLPVNASAATIWHLLKDKARNPKRYLPLPIDDVKITEPYGRGFLREIHVEGAALKEEIIIDEANHQITFINVDNPVFSGKVINQITPNDGGMPIVTYTMDIEDYGEEAKRRNPKVAKFLAKDIPGQLRAAVGQIKKLAEETERNGGITPAASSKGSKSAPGSRKEIVLHLLELVEQNDIESYVTHFTDDARYRVSNNPPAFGPKEITNMAASVKDLFTLVEHDIDNIWELGDKVVVETDVIYTRKDGQVFRFPCSVVVQFRGDKVYDYQAYLDAASAFDMSQGGNEAVQQSQLAKLTGARKRADDYAERDAEGKVAFYVLLWKRKGQAIEHFRNYWRDVHGPVCARLPGQHQYWQFHLDHYEGGVFPEVEGVDYATAPEDRFDGIAELTFKNSHDRDTWFTASSILMDDEHNIFSKAIGYVTKMGHSTTYVDGIDEGAPNGGLGVVKYHVMVKQSERASSDAFREYMQHTFAANIAKNANVLKFRMHLFEPPDVSRPDAAGVSHFEPPDKQYQAAFEIAFRDSLSLEAFFGSPEYKAATRDQHKYVTRMSPFAESDAYTFVYGSEMTVAGQRGSRTAQLITGIGATNQVRSDITDLMGIKQHARATS